MKLMQQSKSCFWSLFTVSLILDYTFSFVYVFTFPSFICLFSSIYVSLFKILFSLSMALFTNTFKFNITHMIFKIDKTLTNKYISVLTWCDYLLFIASRSPF